jgi:hypothetical protein
MKQKILFAVFISVFLSACASLTKQGEEALQEGRYEEALSLFQRAVKEDRNDTKAMGGLKRAQQTWIDRKLIEVRLLRLGYNIGESEKLLIDLLGKENDWQVFPMGVAFTTQDEELNFYAQRVQKRISGLIEKNNPLGAELEFQKNNFVLEKVLQQNTSLLRTQIYSSGKKFCQTQSEALKVNEYFTQVFLERTCNIWKIPVKKRDLKSTVSLFNDVKVTSQVAGLGAKETEILKDNIGKAFNLSKWREPKSPLVLNLEVNGQFSSFSKETPKSRVAEYVVQIPYEETSRRTKDPNRNTGVSGALGLLSLLSGGGNHETVHDNGDGTETVTVTKYRSEFRKYFYKAVEVQAEKDLAGQVKASLDSSSFKFDILEKYRFLEDRHNENFPSAGLTPQDPKFISDPQWVQAVGEHLVIDLTSELQKAWLSRFCNDFSDKALSEKEQVFRCAYQVTSSVPEGLQQYFLKNWQIRYEDWQGLLR